MTTKKSTRVNLNSKKDLQKGHYTIDGK